MLEEKYINDLLRISKDEEFINNRLKFLNSEDGAKWFKVYKHTLYNYATTPESISGYVYYYILKNDAKYGLICVLSNKYILIEVSNEIIKLCDKIDPRKFLVNTLYDYFLSTMREYGIDRIEYKNLDKEDNK